VIELVVSGAGGRLGRRVVGLGLKAPGIARVHGVVRAGSAGEGVDLGLLSGEGTPSGALATSRLEDVLGPGAVLVECAPRKIAVENAAAASAARVPLLIATTGFDRAELAAIEAAGTVVPVLIAPNLSLGVAVLTDLVARASKALAGYHLEMVELHHAKKRDAPSGTAWALARAAAEARGQDVERDAILARAGETGPRGEQEIGLQAVRGGDIIGEHTLYLISAVERLELTHRAQSRDAFAFGAVRAALYLGSADRAPGLYTMRDVLGLA
jgi:4-hydroxy-tetrahydrodipicolinate reductase